MDKIYPKNTAIICHSDAHKAGRELLRNAFLNATKGEGRAGSYRFFKDSKEMKQVITADRPLYWHAQSQETEGPAPYPSKMVNRDAANIRIFLADNGFNVTEEKEPIEDRVDKKSWQDRDLIRVYSNATETSSYTYDPATIAALPHMRRKLWNLVRYDHEKFEF